jgi:hypothetical protein
MSYKGRVGLGVTTWKRPDLYARCRDSILEHLSGVVDHVFVVQDGGDPYVFPAPDGWSVMSHGENLGWAASKNECLDGLYAIDCDWLFMIEDDTTVTSPGAVTGYIDAHAVNGHHYMSAHPWGETSTPLVEVDGPTTYWAYVGSWWTFMTAHGWQTGGPYNDVMGGIMGDIEVVQRWQLKGLTSGWGRIPDATGSEAWVKPSCLTPDQSTICTQPGWLERQEWLIRWWMETMPETMPTEMRPAREGRPSRYCDDVKWAKSAASIEPRFI